MNPIIQFQHVTKRFPGVVALSDVSFDILEGQTHVLIGENGAGKSTLIKLLCGVYTYDDGLILYQGKEYRPSKPLSAINAGIRCVYQEFNLLNHMSIAENIFFQDLPNKHGVVDFRELEEETLQLLERVGLKNISPKLPVDLLGIAQKQLVEIAKALSKNCKVLVLDEPTATLTPPEIEKLFSIIRKLKEQGVTIIYISHRLQELMEIGDRLTVLRNGEYVGTWPVSELSVDAIVTKMVGKSIDANYPFYPDVPVGDTLFEVRDVVVPTSPSGISFSVKAGEIRGVSGLIGSGRTEVVRAIFGADPMQKGRIFLGGKEVKIRKPKDAVKAGICLLTEDRKGQGLVLGMDCASNITLPTVKSLSRCGLLHRELENSKAQKEVDELSIKISTLKQTVGNLSGGNQQKVVLAKWLLCNPRVIILDEPTRGIDVNAKCEIYQLLWKLAETGVAVIFISSDMPELLGVCHNISVFSKGKLVDTIAREDFSQERILASAYKEYLQSSDSKQDS